MIAGVFDWIQEVTDHLDSWAGNWWFIVVIGVIAYLDSVIPVVPSETAVIIGGVAAGQGDQNVVLVIAAGAIGAFCGDTSAYLIGSGMRGFIHRLAARRATYQARLDWAARQIRSRGGPLFLTARFIPGGRTALTVSSGVTHQRFGWFVRWVACAVVIWAGYAGLLGFVFGNTFKDNHTAAFLIAFGASIGVTIVIEVVRHYRGKGAQEASSAA